MQIELTPAQAAFIDLGIQTGRFRDSDDALRQMLTDWENRERTRIELVASLEIATRSLDAGEGESYSADNLNELVASIKANGLNKLACGE